MRIAMLAPIRRPLTPDTTVSRLRVIVDLTRGLVSRGHTVTIFTTADSRLPEADIVGVIPTGVNFLPVSENPLYQHIAYDTIVLETMKKREGEFDVIHNHMYPEFLALLEARSMRTPLITTIHTQITPVIAEALSFFPEKSIVTISNSAKTLSRMNTHMVYNGIDTQFYVPDETGEKRYFLFVGRMSKAKDARGAFIDPKGVTQAIAVAKKTGIRLKIVGNVEDRAFYDTLVAPHLNEKIEFIGDVSAEQILKREELLHLYQGAIALINPIQWDEPFGLVMAESMACATPVIAYKRGSAAEVVEDKKTGFVIDLSKGIDGLAAAIARVGEIDRAYCRTYAESHFSIRHMVDGYENVYQSVVS